MQVSSDYTPETHQEFLAESVTVRFLYDGDPIDEYLLSSEFAKKHDLHDADLMLPEEYPPWTGEMKVLCRSCFNRLTSGQNS